MCFWHAILVDLDFKPAQEVQGSNSYQLSQVEISLVCIISGCWVGSCLHGWLHLKFVVVFSAGGDGRWVYFEKPVFIFREELKIPSCYYFTAGTSPPPPLPLLWICIHTHTHTHAHIFVYIKFRYYFVSEPFESKLQGDVALTSKGWLHGIFSEQGHSLT